MGYLHHARYLEYLEMGRTELLRNGGLAYRDMEAGGFFLVVAKLEVSYRAPARYDDLVDVRTSLRKITRARIEHEYEVTCQGRPLCQASTTLACVDREGRLQPIPEEIYRIAQRSDARNG